GGAVLTAEGPAQRRPSGLTSAVRRIVCQPPVGSSQPLRYSGRIRAASPATPLAVSVTASHSIGLRVRIATFPSRNAGGSRAAYPKWLSAASVLLSLIASPHSRFWLTSLFPS